MGRAPPRPPSPRPGRAPRPPPPRLGRAPRPFRRRPAAAAAGGPAAVPQGEVLRVLSGTGRHPNVRGTSLRSEGRPSPDDGEAPAVVGGGGGCDGGSRASPETDAAAPQRAAPRRHPLRSPRPQGALHSWGLNKILFVLVFLSRMRGLHPKERSCRTAAKVDCSGRPPLRWAEGWGRGGRACRVSPGRLGCQGPGPAASGAQAPV